MSTIIVFYLMILSALTVGNIYSGIRSVLGKRSETGNKRIEAALKAQDGDIIDFAAYGRFNSAMSFVLAILYLSIIAVTFVFISDLAGDLATREIHLLRTCLFAMIALHLSRDMAIASLREKFVNRKAGSAVRRYDIKTSMMFVILVTMMAYGIYTQLTYAW